MAVKARKSLLITALVFITLGLFFALRTAPVISGQQSENISGRCVRVVDGDSLYIEGHKAQIRLWGVDAPEHDERGYQQAKDKLLALAKGKGLRCETKDIDKYGRTVARCYVKDKNKVQIEVNRALLEADVAREYCWFSKGFYGFCDDG